MKPRGEELIANGKDRSSGKDAARTCLALALVLVSSHVLNADIFPTVAQDLPAAREISTYGGVAFSVFLAVAAYRKPSLLRERFWFFACLAATAIAAASLYGGIDGHSSLMLAIGSPFGGIGGAWVSVLAGVSLAQRGPKHAFVVVPTAFVVQYAAKAGIHFLNSLPIEASVALYATSLAAACLLARPDARSVMKNMRDSDAPDVLSITSPSSYLPFSSLIFVSILLFNIVCGYSLASSEAEPSFLPSPRLWHLASSLRGFCGCNDPPTAFSRRIVSHSRTLHYRRTALRAICSSCTARPDRRAGLYRTAFGRIRFVQYAGILHSGLRRIPQQTWSSLRCRNCSGRPVAWHRNRSPYRADGSRPRRPFIAMGHSRHGNHLLHIQLYRAAQFQLRSRGRNGAARPCRRKYKRRKHLGKYHGP